MNGLNSLAWLELVQRPLLLVTVITVVVSVIVLSRPKRYLSLLPPSPPSEPILGHFRKLPLENAHLKHLEYARQYDSPIIYFNVLGNHMIVLNDARSANELLDKRGANYQDRPRFVLFEVMGWGLTLTFLPYGPRFKLHRTAFVKRFSRTAIAAYQTIQEDEARKAVFRMISPMKQHWDTSFRRFAPSIVLRIGYGVKVQDDDDKYIRIATNANMLTIRGGNPGTALVDYLPMYRYVPEFMNFSAPLTHARKMGWAIRDLHDIPFEAVKKEFDDGNINSSFAHGLLTRYKENEEKGVDNAMTLPDIQGASAAVFIAGSNTTLATATIALLGLMENRWVFDKARQELDCVVGTDRLPTLADRANLRFIDYIVEEATRYRPLATIGIPHRSLHDDVYEGMFIPKGTYVYYNNWAISRDTTTYSNPDTFDPDRYIPKSAGGRGEPYIVGPFGFGRRICPGRHLAQASVWILVATLIATTEIRKPVDEKGDQIEQQVNWTTGLSSHPGKFEVDFKVRSERAVELLRQGIDLDP